VRDVHGEKREARLHRHARVRRKISGTAEMPRLAVYRSLNHIYAQLIDDEAGRTIVSASSLRLELPAVEPPASAEAPAGGDKKGGKKKDGKKQPRPVSLKIRRSTAVGARIADFMKERDWDMIVMGAYGRRRFLENLFAGPTHTVPLLADIPVLQAH